MNKAGVSKASRAAHSRLANFLKKPRTSMDLNQDDIWKGDQVYTLMQHTPQYSSADLVLSKDLFPGARESDVLELIPEDHSAPFVLQLTSASLISGKNLTISVHQQISTAFNLPSRDLQVRVQKLSSSTYEIDALVFSIKDQFISRRDMSKIETLTQGKAFYKTQKTSIAGAKLQVTDILANGKPASSGVVTKKTLITFRSKSCRVIWLVEMTKEAWTFTDDGLLLMDKMLAFIRCALERNRMAGSSHSISIVVFARLFYPTATQEEAVVHQLSSNSQGVYYQDVCKEIVEISDLRTAWKATFPRVREEMFSFLHYINWTIGAANIVQKAAAVFTDKRTETLELPCRLSTSQETCFLEMINISLNRFEHHATDRKLTYTGQCIMVISAGVGAYFANQAFVKLTKERIANCAVNLDIVSVNYRPLHLTPVFIHTLEKLQEDRDKAREVEDKETYDMYMRFEDTSPSAGKSASHPTWLRLHFFHSVAQLEGTSNLQSALHTLTLARIKSYPQPLVSFSCFEKSHSSTLSHVNSKLSISLKDTILTVSKSSFTVQAENQSSMLGIMPQSLDQSMVKAHLKSFCNAFDTHVFSSRRDEESHSESPSLTPEIRRSNSKTLSELSQKRLRRTILNYYEPSSFFGPQDEGTSKRKYSEVSSEASVPRSDSPRRNSIHDWTGNHPSRNSMNPFTIKKLEKKRFSRFNRRWAHLFPGTVPVPPDTVETDEFCEKSLTYFECVWRLLLEPALLPLTSDFWPCNEELGNSNPNQSSVAPTSNLSRDTLVRELVNLRLQKEFQIVRNPVDHNGRKMNLNLNDMLLSRGSCNHVILPSQQDEYNVDFRFYTTNEKLLDFSISTRMFNKLSKGFAVKEFRFVSRSETEWEKLDSIILGHASKTNLPLNDTTKCIKMVLLPRHFYGVDKNTESDEENQMADFATFHRLLREALSREQQKVKGDERQTVDIEVLNMRNQQAVLRSNSFVLNLEEPEEWIAVEHDAIFKPNFAFSITLTWICGLGPSVGERVNLMKRKAEQAGLQLIQVPLWEGYELKNPFRPQIRIPLVDSQWMRKALQSSLLCMLEMSPDLMIQKSGAAVVRIVENELFFQDNYIIQSEENQAVYERLLITAAAHEILWDIVEGLKKSGVETLKKK